MNRIEDGEFEYIPSEPYDRVMSAAIIVLGIGLPLAALVYTSSIIPLETINISPEGLAGGGLVLAGVTLAAFRQSLQERARDIITKITTHRNP